MQYIYYTLAAIVLYFTSDWILLRIEKARGKPFAKPYQLYDMSNDIGETTDVAQQNPEVVKRLTERLDQIRQSGRSRDSVN